MHPPRARRPAAVALSGALALLLPGAGHAANVSPESVELVAHQAIFEVTMPWSDEGVGITDHSGHFEFGRSGTCDGTLYWRGQLGMTEYENIEPYRFSYQNRFWVSSDGTRFRKSITSVANDEVDTWLHATASRDSADGPGTAILHGIDDDKQVTRHVQIPDGAVLPDQFRKTLIAAAQSGERRWSGRLFDPYSTSLAFEDVEVTISNPQDGVDIEGIDSELLDQRNWEFRVEYHTVDEDADEGPNRVLTHRMTRQGVTVSYRLESDTFTDRGRLARLERLPAPDC